MKVLVVDDSLLFRRIMLDALSSLPDVEVVGQASHGKLALQRLRELRPDLMTLDLEMPEMAGLAVLDAMREAGDKTAVIVVSALSRQGARITMQALQKGAFDFITKPDTPSPAESRDFLRSELAPRLRALSLRLGVRHILRSASAPAAAATATAPLASPAPPQAASPAPAKAAPLDEIRSRMDRLTKTARPEMVLIGVSTGGPNALDCLLPALPGNLGVPVLIVQHMPPVFTQSLAESLDARCALRVSEAAPGEIAEANHVYIAPGGRQMRLAAGPRGEKIIQITDDPPENNCRPAVDYLFRSVSLQFAGRAMAVILTGMGSDGTLGLRLLKRNGCLVLAQDESSCVVYSMPKAAVEAGVVDVILPLEAIAGRIAAAIRGGGL